VKAVSRAVTLALAALVAAAVPAGALAVERRDLVARTVHVEALRQPTRDGELRFKQRRLSAPAGRVTFVFRNPAVLPHNFAVRKPRGKTLGVTATIANGRTARLVLTLRRGRYVFFCAVPGHEAAGMHGTLVVT
jgi:uncharacterized cupredoxin-like copper-binding protein